MTKISWKAGTMLSPLPPAMISCGTVENPNVLTVAWTGIIASDPAMTYVSIRPSRYSHNIIKESGEFVINLPNLAMLTAVDFCGVKSGKDTNKFKEMNLTAIACSNVSAPQIEEAPVSLECKVKSITNYGSHDMFLAEIVSVNVDDKYLDDKGKLCLEKAGLLAFSHGTYFTLGRELGTMGFSVNKRRLAQMEKMKKVEVTVKEKKFVADAEEAAPKKEFKPRAKREDKGEGFERKPRADRGEGFERRPRSDRGEGFERRPRPTGDRPERRSSDDRRPPRRDFGDSKPRRDREEGFERRPRPTGDRPERRSSDDRRPPRRDFGDSKPRSGGSSGGRKPFSGGKPRAR